jgi:L-ascorbate metabolism protein UlaG (beta-lactamase superfamily)
MHIVQQETRYVMASIHTVYLSTQKEDVNIENGSLFFIGTATVLLRYAGFTILTDPNFLHQGDHIHAGYGLQAVRLTNPGLELDQLPPLDFVLLSHLHEDHFDRLVAKKLDKGVPIVTTSQAAKALHKKGFRLTYALNTWETITMAKGEQQLHITAMPGEHGRGPLAKMLPAVMGSMLEFETSPGKIPFRLYITGDTLLFKHLKEIPERYPDIDLALLHLGGTKFFGVMLTMDAKQGVEAIRLINPHNSIPIHYNDYNVFKSSLDDFKRAVAAAGLEERVKYLNHGDTYTFGVPVDRQ